MNPKYIFITLIVIGVGAAGYFFMKPEDTSTEPPLDTTALEESPETIENVVEDIVPTENTAGNTMRSCDIVEAEGVCMELVGSMYEQEIVAMQSCGEEGTYKLEPCPQGSFGGCKTGGGTSMEMITYMYPNAKNEIDASSAEESQIACEASPMGEWITQ